MATIGINALFLLPNKVGGTEYHLRNVIASWQQEDSSNSYIVYANRENASTFGTMPDNWRVYACAVAATNRMQRVLYEQCIFPFILLRDGVEEIRSFGYLGPILFPRRKWVTVHDANWKDCQEDFSFAERIVLTVLIEGSLTTAHTVITDSKFSKERLVHHFPWLAKKIKILPPAVSEKFIFEAKKKHKHPLDGKKYVLTVSGFYPHKKIPYAIELMNKVMEEEGDLYYVVIGNNGKDIREVTEMIQANPRIIHLPKVSLSELVSYYQHASLFLFPSTYEGFGYPVYEAAYHNISLIVGNCELYDHSVSKKIYELEFNLNTDTTLLRKIWNKYV